MIGVQCPYADCDKINFVIVLLFPSFWLMHCLKCKRDYYINQAVVDPVAMTLDEFGKSYYVEDNQVKSIIPRANES